MKSTIIFLLCALPLIGTTTYAHHSFGAVYDSKKSITLEGTLVQFLFRNPHSFVHMEAPDEHGVMRRWALEWSAAGALGGQGLNSNSLKVGDHIIVTGRPSRVPGEFRVQLQTIK